MLPALYTLPSLRFDLRATHARTLLPAALASVSFGFVLVRVRVRILIFRIWIRWWISFFKSLKNPIKESARRSEGYEASVSNASSSTQTLRSAR